MRGSLFVVSVASLLVSACGGSTPDPATPKPLETRAAAIATPQSDGATTQAGLRASMMQKAEAAAKSVTWSEKPSFDALPTTGLFGAVGDASFPITDVELQVSEAAGTWTFRARGGVSGILGPSLTLQGAPAVGQLYTAPMGANSGYFQVPRAGSTVSTKEFSDTIDLTGENAYVLEITKLELAADGKTGMANGRFLVMQKEGGSDFPPMRAGGTFKDATVRVWKK